MVSAPAMGAEAPVALAAGSWRWLASKENRGRPPGGRTPEPRLEVRVCRRLSIV